VPSAFDEPLNFYRLPGLTAYGAEYPGHPGSPIVTRAKLEWLARHGVSRLIDLTTPEERLTPYEPVLAGLEARVGGGVAPIERVAHPIPDQSVPPTPAALTAIVDAVHGDLAAGRRVAVHCWGGIGRTGLVAAALLVRDGWPVELALDAVNERWQSTRKARLALYAGRCAPENDRQRDFVRAWAASPEARPMDAGRWTAIRRARGCLLGGALGDALGAYVEFMSLRDIVAAVGDAGVVAPLPAYGRAGAITDDTQMTLFTGEAMLRWRAAGTPDDEPARRRLFAHAYLRWFRTQGERLPTGLDAAVDGDPSWLLADRRLHARRAPCLTCLGGLRALRAEALAPARNRSKGNGGVMRAAPIGLAAASPEEAFALGRLSASVTHGHPSGTIAAGAMAALVASIARGEGLVPALADVLRRLRPLDDAHEVTAALDRALVLAAHGGPPTAAAVESLGEGKVAEEALAIALYAVLVHPDDFVAATRLAVNHGGDSDTTGAITGQLSGLLVGVDGLPADWLAMLELRDVLEEMADDLVLGHDPTPGWMARYPAR
jgi:ADP-ribosylglycohydrolase